MAERIHLAGRWEEPELDCMSREELRQYLRELYARMEALDDQEPERMDSPAYDDWAQYHEMLEDLVDDVLDRLE